jgi:hypothetical protein
VAGYRGKYKTKSIPVQLPPILHCQCCHHLNPVSDPFHPPCACSCCGSSLAPAPRVADSLPPKNPDGTVTVYHGTTRARAADIIREGKLRPGPEGAAFVTTTPADVGYGEVVLKLRLRPTRMFLDDEFPGGRRDYRVEPAFPGGSIPVVVES